MVKLLATLKNNIIQQSTEKHFHLFILGQNTLKPLSNLCHLITFCSEAEIAKYR